MKLLSLLLSSLALTACSAGGGGSSSATDPVFGDWYYEAPGSTNTSGRGIIAKFDSGGTVSIASVYIYVNNGNAIAYTRKSLGTWTRSGDEFTFNYTYETCNPVKTEKMRIKVVGDKLNVEGAGTVITMAHPSGKSSINTMAAIEDKNCNILSKLDTKSSRIPASANSALSGGI